jgi:predicted alpha/beta superfamily hydrolase
MRLIPLLLALLLLPAAQAANLADTKPTPVTLPRADRYDFRSAVTGRDYRVQVAMPYKAEAGKKYPVFYVLDGNWYFLPAADNVTESGDTIRQAIVVGIGYPTDENSEVHRRRGFELTPATGLSTRNGNPSGGGDDFIRMLLEEVKPLVEARYPVDTTRQSLYGKSLGGLMVLRVLFRHPEAFQTYVAASPAIFYDNSAVLKDEPAFAEKARAGALRIRILITNASEEQYHDKDPAELKRSRELAWLENASALAARLGALNPEKISATYTLFQDEDHVSVSLAELGRGLKFALKW